MTADISRLPMPAGAAAEPPLSEQQHALRRAIAARAHEERLVAGVSERLQRLEAVLAGDRQLEAKIRELALAYQTALADWIEAGRAGAEPRRPAELVDAECLHAQQQGDVAASLQRVPAVQGEQRAAVERLTGASREVDLAVFAAAVECCRPIAALAAAGLREGLTQLAKLLSVAAALRQGDDVAAYRAASEIDPLISQARAAGVPPSPEIGRQLLERLHIDPMSALPR